MKSIEGCRAQFAVTNECAFLDNAAVAPMSERACERMREYIDEAARLARPAGRKWAETAQSARSMAAALMGARVDEIAFTSSTSMGLALIAASLDWRAGESVVTAANEFPANMYPWLNLKRRGVHVKAVAPRGDGRVAVEDLAAAIDRHTRVVALSWVGFNTGLRVDLARLGRECRRRGALLVVDAIQGLGAFDMKVAEWGVAAAAADAHKWLLGPEGIALLYVSRKLADSLNPAVVGWKSVRNPYDFLHYDFTLADGAARFEQGTNNTAGVHGLCGALELIEKAGSSQITARCRHLAEYLRVGLRAKGLKELWPHGAHDWSPIVAFDAPGGDGPEAARALEKDGIIVTGRAGFLRASPHFYNNETDIDRLLSAF